MLKYHNTHMLMLSSAMKGEIPIMETIDLETEKREIQEFIRSIRNKLTPWSGEKDSNTDMLANSKPANQTVEFLRKPASRVFEKTNMFRKSKYQDYLSLTTSVEGAMNLTFVFLEISDQLQDVCCG